MDTELTLSRVQYCKKKKISEYSGTRKKFLFVVRFAFEYPECPVDLLNEEEAGHLVGKRHTGE